MPCYTVNTVSVEFKAKNRALLDKAIKSLNWEVQGALSTASVLVVTPNGGADITINLVTGTAEVLSGQQPRLNELKRAYSKQALSLAAKLGGWQNVNLTQTKGQLIRGVC